MKQITKLPVILSSTVILATYLAVSTLPVSASDNARNPVQDAALWIKNNGGSPKEMKPFAQKIDGLPKEEKAKLVAAIRPFLRSSKWEEQANAIYLLGYLGDSATPAVPEIIKAMDAPMSNVAWEAAPALARIGSPAMPALIAALKAEKPGTSKRIHNLTKCIKEMGPKALAAAPLLVPFLDDGHNTGAIDALVSIGPSCLPDICQGFDKDARSVVVVHAGYVFEKLGIATSSKALVNYLKGKCSETGKKNAVFALARMKPAPDKVAIAILCKIMAEGNKDTLENAALALTAIGPQAAPDVLELASNRDSEVRERVQKILRTYDTNPVASSASVQVLVNKLNKANTEDAAQLAATILKLQPNNAQAITKLRQILISKLPGESNVALRSIPQAGSGGKALVPDLIKILNTAPTDQRLLAAAALGTIGPGAKDAVKPLIQAATIAHPIVVSAHEGFNYTSSMHQTCIEALGKIGPEAQPAIPLFCKLLKDKSQSFLHKDIYSALTLMGKASEQAMSTVLDCFRTNPDEREAIIDLLTKMGTGARSAESDLRNLLTDRDNNSRFIKKRVYLALLAVQPDPLKTSSDTKAMLKEDAYELQEAALKQIIAKPVLAKDPEISSLLVKCTESYNYGLKQLALEAIAHSGASDDKLLPKLIKENIGCSYSEPQKQNAFAAIKKMDPTGAKTLPLVQKSLNDAFEVRGAVELLEYIGSAQTLPVARETRKRWKLE